MKQENKFRLKKLEVSSKMRHQQITYFVDSRCLKLSEKNTLRTNFRGKFFFCISQKFLGRQFAKIYHF